MGLRFDPIGGGQFKQAVKQIIEAESQPIKQLEARKAREDVRLKLFQEFKGKFAGMSKALEDLSSFQKFRELKVDLGDGAKQINVTLDKDKAQPGSYQIMVEQLAARTSAISNGFEDADDPVLGVGFINMTLANGDTAEVYIDDDESSLRGVAKLINKQSDSPIRASVLKDAGDPEEPWKLILTAKKDGAENSITFPEFYFLDGSKDFYVDDSRDAQNAIIELDGFPLELESNDVTDFLPGVNIHLKQAKPDEPFEMSISEDFQKISGKVKGLVEEINKILEFINKQNKVDDKSDTRTTFAGDSGLFSIENRLRNLVHEGYPVGDPDSDDFYLLHLNSLGIEFNREGVLLFKEDKFAQTMEKDFEKTAQAVCGELGFATMMKQSVDSFMLSGTGILAAREAGLRSRIKEYDRQIENKQRHIDRRQQALVEQFSRLESTLSGMQRTSSYLAASLPGAGGGGNIVSQLLGG